MHKTKSDNKATNTNKNLEFTRYKLFLIVVLTTHFSCGYYLTSLLTKRRIKQ